LLTRALAGTVPHFPSTEKYAVFPEVFSHSRFRKRFGTKSALTLLPEKNVNFLLSGFCFLTLIRSPLEAVSVPVPGTSAPIERVV
jgi:hypothetical protein